MTVHHNMNHAVDPIIITDAKCVCEKARRLWLQPENDQSLNQAEWLYRQIWNRRTTTTTTDGTDAVVDDNHVHDRIHHVSKKSKTENVPGGDDDDDDDDDNINKNTCDADTTDWVRHAGEKLALMLLQSGRSTEADQILTTLQYTCRLSELLFNYPFEEENSSNGPNQKKNDYFISTVPCRVFNHFVTKQEMHMFQTVFQDPRSDYWTDHHYSVEPPSPYFSYLIPLQPPPPPDPSLLHDDNSNIGIVAFVHRLRNYLQAHFPVAHASYCEMWAHNRYHATGHQFHFDSDNEGCTGRVLRNPICSCIVYLSDEKVGGPSIITHQRLASHSLATKGWMCHPKLGRLVVFDGTVLHGVIPGKPVDSALGGGPRDVTKIDDDSHHAGSEQSSSNNFPTGRRVSVMFAFWRKIRLREHDTNVVGGGAAQSLPESPEWAKQLRQRPTDSSISSSTVATDDEIIRPVVAVEAMTLDHIYVSTSNGRPWSRSMGMPNYDEIFQGF